jgi:hypothetical protein
MILNRVAKHLKEQHWFAVFLDLVIVVVGVFLGLQAQDWNQARQEHALEHQYLQRLRADFAQSAEDAKSNIKEMQPQVRLEGQMVNHLRKCHLDAAQRFDFAKGLLNLGKFYPASLVRGTIDELRSSGRMGIIENLALRRKISDIVRVQEQEAQILGYIVDRATPDIVYIDQRDTLIQPPGGFKDGSKAGSPGRVVFDFAALCHDPTYISALSALQWMTHVIVRQNQAQLGDYRTLVAMIDSELGKNR